MLVYVSCLRPTLRPVGDARRLGLLEVGCMRKDLREQQRLLADKPAYPEIAHAQGRPCHASDV